MKLQNKLIYKLFPTDFVNEISIEDDLKTFFININKEDDKYEEVDKKYNGDD